MPVISMFYGLVVRMFYFDVDRHKQPHIHVEFGENRVVVSLDNGEVLAGNLPGSKLKLVQAWIEIHKDELSQDWALAVRGEPIFKIDPLR